MGYVEDVLQPGEQIRYRGRVSWVVYARSIFFFALAWTVFFGITAQSEGILFAKRWAIMLLLGVSLIALFVGWLSRKTTEIVATDRRIILKVGLIRRRTIEMNMNKVESVDVTQSLLGRIFNFGDVVVRGVGVGIEPLKMIGAPLEFRRHVSTA